jgi:FkbM family methyltransferase
MEVLVESNNLRFQMFIPDVNIHESYPGGNVQMEIMKNKVWAVDETNIMNKILQRQKGLVIDVGANTGYFSFIGLKNGCQVVAIEPNPIHSQYFYKTIEINNFNPEMITHLEMFVSTQKKDYIFDGWTGNDKLISHNANDLYQVKTIGLNDICSDCLFLKIDVEGNEPDVIRSASSLLENNKIKYIMFELTYMMNNAVDSENVEMLEILINHGFTLFEIEPNILKEISDIQTKVAKWEHEYFNHHQKINPNISNAGCNILAIHVSAENIFKKIKNTNNFYI